MMSRMTDQRNVVSSGFDSIHRVNYLLCGSATREENT